jgi:hypothetical protein
MNPNLSFRLEERNLSLLLVLKERFLAALQMTAWAQMT